MKNSPDSGDMACLLLSRRLAGHRLLSSRTIIYFAAAVPIKRKPLDINAAKNTLNSFISSSSTWFFHTQKRRAMV